MQKVPQSEHKTKDQQLIEETVITPFSTHIRKFSKGTFLGTGAFGTCYEIIDTATNETHAAKIFSKAAFTEKPRLKQHYENEIKINQALRHTNIVAFHHSFEDKENAYLLFERCDNENLKQVLAKRKRFSEAEVKVDFVQIINAVKYMHSQKIVHRDIKPANILLKNKNMKLCDFGIAFQVAFEGEKQYKEWGTPAYMAPEMLDSKLGYSYEIDIWALGVLMYEMITGDNPFEGKTVAEAKEKIKKNSFVFPENLRLSEPCMKLITDILVSDPLQRPSLDKILSSEFFAWKDLSRHACPKSLFVSSHEHSKCIKLHFREQSQNKIKNNESNKNIPVTQSAKRDYLSPKNFSIPKKKNSEDVNKINMISNIKKIGNIIKRTNQSMPSLSGVGAFSFRPGEVLRCKHLNHTTNTFLNKNKEIVKRNNVSLPKLIHSHNKPLVGYPIKVIPEVHKDLHSNETESDTEQEVSAKLPHIPEYPKKKRTLIKLRS